LIAEDSHYFDDAVIGYAVVLLSTPHTLRPVSLTDMFDSRIGIRALGYFLEAVKQCVVVTVRRCLAPSLEAISIDALQITFGSLGEFIRCHLSWLLPSFDFRKDSVTVRRHKAALFGLNQFGANELDLLFRSAGFADEIIHNVAFAAVFAALNLCH
jgi:hypothetical protein